MNMGVSEDRGTLLRVPMMRVLLFWGYLKGTTIWGDTHLQFEAEQSVAFLCCRCMSAALVATSVVFSVLMSPNSVVLRITAICLFH